MFTSWTSENSGPLAELAELYARLDEMKAKLDQMRPLPPEALKSLRADLTLRFTYNSNAIEGNTLTLNETKVVLEDGITIGGKTVREHLEAVNHRDAVELMSDMAQSREPLREKSILELHGIVLRGLNDHHAGRYRSSNVRIMGATHLPPRAEKVPELMKAFIGWHATKAANLPVVERVARAHADFVNIHPFVDGNGRTARLLMNLELLKAGYPIAIIPVEERLAYYDNLDRIPTRGEYAPFVEQIGALVQSGFEPYFAMTA